MGSLGHGDTDGHSVGGARLSRFRTERAKSHLQLRPDGVIVVRVEVESVGCISWFGDGE